MPLSYCQTIPWACIPLWPLLYFSPDLSKPVFWKDCPCLSPLLSHLFPVKPLQLDFPSPPAAESFRGITHLHVGKPKDRFCVYLLSFSIVIAIVSTEKLNTFSFHETLFQVFYSTSLTILLFRFSFLPSVVYWVWLLDACENLLLIFQKLSELVDVLLVARNWLWWSIDTKKLAVLKINPPSIPRALSIQQHPNCFKPYPP